LNPHTENKIPEVLIVEDELDICYLLSAILRKKHLKPSYATSLSEASKAIEVKNPDILFLDNHLPDGFGVNFISTIKRNCPQTKIIMITAYDTPEDRNKALEQGADFFIGKPFTGGVILQTVDTLLQAI
jgi:two-component system OmpR family response regulator